MSVLNRATTQVIKCPSCGQYYPEDERHACGLANIPASPPALPPFSPGGPDADSLVGTLVGERYKILAKLGQGGMGAVYEAMQDSIERRVALKVLLPAVAQDQEAAKRFINEARAVNRVNHPGLVQISDSGKLASGSPYIVMEFLKGETLRQRIARLGGALPVADAMELSSQIAESLAAAHGIGIVHRDQFAPYRTRPASFQRHNSPSASAGNEPSPT